MVSHSQRSCRILWIDLNKAYRFEQWERATRIQQEDWTLEEAWHEVDAFHEHIFWKEIKFEDWRGSELVRSDPCGMRHKKKKKKLKSKEISWKWGKGGRMAVSYPTEWPLTSVENTGILWKWGTSGRMAVNYPVEWLLTSVKNTGILWKRTNDERTSISYSLEWPRRLHVQERQSPLSLQTDIEKWSWKCLRRPSEWPRRSARQRKALNASAAPPDVPQEFPFIWWSLFVYWWGVSREVLSSRSKHCTPWCSSAGRGSNMSTCAAKKKYWMPLSVTILMRLSRGIKQTASVAPHDAPQKSEEEAKKHRHMSAT